MINDGRVLGLPLVQYRDLRANIEAIPNAEEGMLAYATDDDVFLQHDGSVWTELAGGLTWVLVQGTEPSSPFTGLVWVDIS